MYDPSGDLHPETGNMCWLEIKQCTNTFLFAALNQPKPNTACHALRLHQHFCETPFWLVQMNKRPTSKALHHRWIWIKYLSFLMNPSVDRKSHDSLEERLPAQQPLHAPQKPVINKSSGCYFRNGEVQRKHIVLLDDILTAIRNTAHVPGIR